MSEKKVLSIDEMLSTPDEQFENVEAWGGIVRIGSLTAGEMIEFVEANEGAAKRTAGLRLIVASIVDKDNKRIGDPKVHVDLFRKKSVKETSKIVDAILKMNGMEKAADVKDKVKND